MKLWERNTFYDQHSWKYSKKWGSTDGVKTDRALEPCTKAELPRTNGSELLLFSCEMLSNNANIGLHLRSTPVDRPKKLQRLKLLYDQCLDFSDCHQLSWGPERVRSGQRGCFLPSCSLWKCAVRGWTMGMQLQIPKTSMLMYL